MKSICIKNRTVVKKVDEVTAHQLVETGKYTYASKKEYKEYRLEHKSKPVVTKYPTRSGGYVGKTPSCNKAGKYKYIRVKANNDPNDTSTRVVKVNIFESNKQQKNYVNSVAYKEQKAEELVEVLANQVPKQSPPAKNPNKIKRWISPIKNRPQLKFELPEYSGVHVIEYKQHRLDVVIQLPSYIAYASDSWKHDEIQQIRIAEKCKELQEGFIAYTIANETVRKGRVNNLKLRTNIDFTNYSDDELTKVEQFIKDIISMEIEDTERRETFTVLMIINGKVTMNTGKVFGFRSLMSNRFKLPIDKVELK